MKVDHLLGKKEVHQLQSSMKSKDLLRFLGLAMFKVMDISKIQSKMEIYQQQTTVLILKIKSNQPHRDIQDHQQIQRVLSQSKF